MLRRQYIVRLSQSSIFNWKIISIEYKDIIFRCDSYKWYNIWNSWWDRIPNRDVHLYEESRYFPLFNWMECRLVWQLSVWNGTSDCNTDDCPFWSIKYAYEWCCRAIRLCSEILIVNIGYCVTYLCPQIPHYSSYSNNRTIIRAPYAQRTICSFNFNFRQLLDNFLDKTYWFPTLS